VFVVEISFKPEGRKRRWRSLSAREGKEKGRNRKKRGERASLSFYRGRKGENQGEREGKKPDQLHHRSHERKKGSKRRAAAGIGDQDGKERKGAKERMLPSSEREGEKKGGPGEDLRFAIRSPTLENGEKKKRGPWRARPSALFLQFAKIKKREKKKGKGGNLGRGKKKGKECEG